MANNITFGYVRVSSTDQNEARQVEKMREMGIDERHIFIDKKSGKDFEREQYRAMMAMLREGDLVCIASLDRLGRNYREMAQEWEAITKVKKADILVMDMADLLDTRKKTDLTGTFINDMVVRLLSYVAEKEREAIRIRQAEGIAIAKAEGKYTGRKTITVDKEQFEKLYAEVVRGERTNRYVMQKMNLKPNTYYRLVSEYKSKTGQWKD